MQKALYKHLVALSELCDSVAAVVTNSPLEFDIHSVDYTLRNSPVRTAYVSCEMIRAFCCVVGYNRPSTSLSTYLYYIVYYQKCALGYKCSSSKY